MNTNLFSRLYLDSTNRQFEWSQPMSIEGNNAAQWDTTVFALTATNVSFLLQVSNDLQNWTNVGSAQTTSQIGHKLFAADTAISTAYVRLKLSINGTGTAVLAASLNIAPL